MNCKITLSYLDMQIRKAHAIISVMASLTLILTLKSSLAFAGAASATYESRFRYPNALYGITVTPQNPQPGDVVVVWANVDAQLASQPNSASVSTAPVSGSFRNQSVNFSLDDLDSPGVQSSAGISRYVSLIGLGALTPAGIYTLTIDLILNSGDHVHANRAITVAQRLSYSEYISLSAALASTLDPAVNSDEARTFAEIYSAYTEPARWSHAMLLPIAGRFAAFYGNRRVYNGIDLGTYHSGVDIVAGIGTPIKAAAPGRVVVVAPFIVHGLSVVLDHGHGVFTTYSHLSKSSVTPGQVVREGESIGKVGTSGRSQGPHLHFELAVGGSAIDPLPWLTHILPGGLTTPADYLAASDELPGRRNTEHAR